MKLYYENGICEPNEENLKIAVDYILTFKTKEELRELVKMALKGNFEPLRADLTEYFEKTIR